MHIPRQASIVNAVFVINTELSQGSHKLCWNRLFKETSRSQGILLRQLSFKCNKDYTTIEFKDYLCREIQSVKVEIYGDVILLRPSTNNTRHSIRYRGAIAWNSLSSKESTAENLNEFKRLLTEFDISKINFDTIIAVFFLFRFAWNWKIHRCYWLWIYLGVFKVIICNYFVIICLNTRSHWLCWLLLSW